MVLPMWMPDFFKVTAPVFQGRVLLSSVLLLTIQHICDIWQDVTQLTAFSQLNDKSQTPTSSPTDNRMDLKVVENKRCRTSYDSRGGNLQKKN